VLSVKGNDSLRENITDVFGLKQVRRFELLLPEWKLVSLSDLYTYSDQIRPAGPYGEWCFYGVGHTPQPDRAGSSVFRTPLMPAPFDLERPSFSW